MQSGRTPRLRTSVTHILALGTLTTGVVLAAPAPALAEAGCLVNDVLVPYGPDKIVNGTSEDDKIICMLANQAGYTVSGLEGDDTIEINYSNTGGINNAGTINGGNGNDTINLSPAGIEGNTKTGVIHGGPGNDRINALGGNNGLIQGGLGADHIVGGGGIYSPHHEGGIIEGNEGNDTLISEGGNGGGASFSTIDGGLGNDRICGGAGYVDYELVLHCLRRAGYGMKLFGGPGADHIIGSAIGPDTIHGGGGAQEGTDGADFICGERGTVTAGLLTTCAATDELSDGNDTIHGGDGIDVIFGQHGNDQLFGDLGADVLRGGEGTDSANGGNGIDTCTAETKVSCEL